MMTDKIMERLRSSLGAEPTKEQEEAFRQWTLFLTDDDPRTAMILRGSAGTGKTTLAAAIVRTLTELHRKVVLMASTGRAAKVFAQNCLRIGTPSTAVQKAFTIHRQIYRQRSVGGVFDLNDNLHTDTLFMVDEASMIANDGMGNAVFGSGYLLDDLVDYVYAGKGCRLMLIGDAAQLPPVGQKESPALQAETIEAYGLTVYTCELSQVVRQADASGILWHATAIRRLIGHDPVTQLPTIRFDRFADIRRISGDELVDALATSYYQAGMDETMVITRSNKRAGIYNMGIRNRILDREEELSAGDRLMVVKNKYLPVDISSTAPSFIANGDRAVVQRVRHERELYGFRFADVWLRFPDYDDYEMQTVALLDSLHSESPALTAVQQEKLFDGVMEDYAHLPRKADRMKALREDPYYNALQVKYAYAVTCHKAQGGQWKHVYIDQGYVAPDMLTADYVHWLYTAFTRATECLFLVNWREEAPSVDA